MPIDPDPRIDRSRYLPATTRGWSPPVDGSAFAEPVLSVLPGWSRSLFSEGTP
ncbi:hypothetical protein GCM10027360_48190 [Amycolatopsis echigonensis]